MSALSFLSLSDEPGAPPGGAGRVSSYRELHVQKTRPCRSPTLRASLTPLQTPHEHGWGPEIRFIFATDLSALRRQGPRRPLPLGSMFIISRRDENRFDHHRHQQSRVERRALRKALWASVSCQLLLATYIVAEQAGLGMRTYCCNLLIFRCRSKKSHTHSQSQSRPMTFEDMFSTAERHHVYHMHIVQVQLLRRVPADARSLWPHTWYSLDPRLGIMAEIATCA